MRRTLGRCLETWYIFPLAALTGWRFGWWWSVTYLAAAAGAVYAGYHWVDWFDKHAPEEE